jgi:hypothetical protein
VVKIVFIADSFDEWRTKGKKDRCTIRLGVSEAQLKKSKSNEAIFCICWGAAGLIHQLWV